MATPKVSITFDADLSQLKKATADAEKSVGTFEDSVLNFSKKTAAAFALATAAAAAYATKLVVDGVQSAIADEAAQLRLAGALRTATAATDSQIAATETYISKTSLATGIADDKLRPAFQKLAVATGDLTKSQDILNLAIDVSRGTGVDLEAVVTQLSKAYAGQDTGLARLGVGITAADAKTMDFAGNVQKLTNLWGGAAAASSDTLSVKLEIMKNRFNEAKESIGTALLPILTKFAEYLIANVVPAIEAFVAGLTGDKSLTSGFKDSQLAAFNFGEDLRGLIKTVISLKDQIIFVGTAIAGVFTVAAIAGGISSIVTAIKTLILAYNALKASAIVAGVASYFALNPLAGLGATAVAAGILAGANALARNSDVSTDFSSGGTSFTYGSGNPMDFSGSATGGGTTGGGFTGGGLTGGSAGGKSGSTYDQMFGELTKTVDQLKKFGDDQRKIQAQLDIQNNIIFANAMPDEDQLRAQRLAAITLAAMKADDPAAFGNTINITVNGAIDSEGTARTIVNSLNDSYYRGTSGASSLAGIGN